MKPKKIFPNHDTHECHLHMAPGDRVVSDYSGELTYHTILQVTHGGISQSRITLQVDPPLGYLNGCDAAWFRPCGPNSEYERLYNVANSFMTYPVIRSNGKFDDRLLCAKCGATGHLAKDCPWSRADDETARQHG